MLQWHIWQKYHRTSEVIGGKTLELPNSISYSPRREAEAKLYCRWRVFTPKECSVAQFGDEVKEGPWKYVSDCHTSIVFLSAAFQLFIQLWAELYLWWLLSTAVFCWWWGFNESLFFKELCLVLSQYAKSTLRPFLIYVGIAILYNTAGSDGALAVFIPLIVFTSIWTRINQTVRRVLQSFGRVVATQAASLRKQCLFTPLWPYLCWQSLNQMLSLNEWSSSSSIEDTEYARKKEKKKRILNLFS